MNLDFANKFMDDNRERVVNLFINYQMIETLLFLNLFLPHIELGIEEINKRMSRKTFGNLSTQYNKRFPKDDFEIKDLLSICTDQRNSFMHSFWILLGLFGDTSEGQKQCEEFFVSFEDNASALFAKIKEMKDIPKTEYSYNEQSFKEQLLFGQCFI